jgi:hypothetical protein
MGVVETIVKAYYSGTRSPLAFLRSMDGQASHPNMPSDEYQKIAVSRERPVKYVQASTLAEHPRGCLPPADGIQ